MYYRTILISLIFYNALIESLRRAVPVIRCRSYRKLQAASTIYDDGTTMFKGKQRRKLNISQKPEVLSPAGGWSQLKAAVANGCDACYFGLQEGFNARARASNFALDELPEVMSYLHERGKKGYLTMNILVFDSELGHLEDVIKKVAQSGVDALIMQDVGAVDLIRKVAPNLPVHGSTQMSITDSHGVDFAKSALSIDRVVVGRELSLNEIKSISEENKYGVEIEAFVHGALCVSYSGQCYSSEAWGGRSANRGQCAQACRLPYGLIVNGTLKELRDDVQYLLSPQDLMAVDAVPQLIEAGVKSFKIEGRLKGPEYVAVTTRVYREAVDEAWNILTKSYDPKDPRSDEKLFHGPDESMRKMLKQTFARAQDEEFDGLSKGFLEGPRHQNLVRGNSPRHRGLYVGVTRGASSRGIIVDVISPLKRGDGLVFDRRRPEEKEEGGSIYEILDPKSGQSVQKGNEGVTGTLMLGFGRNVIDHSRIKPGDLVWKNKDPHLDAKLQSFAELGESQNQIMDCEVAVSGKIGHQLEIILSCQGFQGRGLTNSKLLSALKRPLTEEDLLLAIGTLGDTPLRIANSKVDTSHVDFTPGLFVPISEIKTARRQALDMLLQNLRKHNRDDNLAPEGTSLHEDMKNAAREIATEAALHDNEKDLQVSDAGFRLSILCRTPAQVSVVCSIDWIDEVILDFLEIHGLRESVKEVRSSGKKVIVATPRIIKPDEGKLYSFYLRLLPDALLVRSAGFLAQLLDLGGAGAITESGIKIPELRGDSFLNTANALTAKVFLETGLSRITPTLDLNADQISSLGEILGPLGASKLECVVHQHLPIFHTEHCVFCRFLSSGSNYRDCGHPCESNSVSLRSMSGEDHLVLADQGCRNTVFNARAQSGAFFAKSFLLAGIKNFRIELVDEPPEYVENLLVKYRNVFSAAKLSCTDKGAMDVEARALEELEIFLNSVPNKYGLKQGFSTGSLEPGEEIKRSDMKKTSRK